MQQMNRTFLLASIILFSQQSLAAKLTDYRNISLQELSNVEVSIATGNGTSLAKVPATTTVIYASDIENMGATSINEVLERVAGLHVTLSSLSRLDFVYSIRGMQSGFNAEFLVMINGSVIKNAVQGGRPVLFRFPVHTIERIEIIRGPGSAVYGADAYSGVMNIITKDGSSIDKTVIGASTGSFNSKEAWLETAGQIGNFRTALHFNYQESDGDKGRIIDNDLQSVLDGTFGTNASLARGSLSTRYKILDTRLTITGAKTQFNFWTWRSVDAGIGVGSAMALDPEGYTDDRIYMADVNYHFENSIPGLENTLRASYLDIKHDNYFNILPKGSIVPIGRDGNMDFTDPVGIVLFKDGLIGAPDAATVNTEIEFSSTYSGFDSHVTRIAAGAGRLSLEARERKNFGPGVIDGTEGVVDGTLTDVRGTTNIFLDDNSRHMHYVSFQDEYHMTDSLIFTAGVRYDRYSDFGGTTNPRLALVWNTSDKMTTKLLYGTAFRAPSFSELYYRNNPVTQGNKNVNPEQLESVELAFSYMFTSKLKTNVTIFDYAAIDMIEFIPDSNGGSKTAQNAKSQDGTGAEVEVSYKPGNHLSVNASYSYQRSIDHNGDVVSDAPAEQFKISIDWNVYKNIFWNTFAYNISDRERPAGDVREKVAEYTITNTNFRFADIYPKLDLNISMKNLFNERALEPSGTSPTSDHPLEGRSIWVGLKYSM